MFLFGSRLGASLAGVPKSNFQNKESKTKQVLGAFFFLRFCSILEVSDAGFSVRVFLFNAKVKAKIHHCICRASSRFAPPDFGAKSPAPHATPNATPSRGLETLKQWF